GYYGLGVGHSIYDFYMREYRGVDPEDGLSQWSVYYVDNNDNGEYDSDESISSLAQYKSENPNKTNQIKKGKTKVYNDATQFYVGKTAIPDLRGAINLSAGYKGFSLSVQMLYRLGG